MYCTIQVKQHILLHLRDIGSDLHVKSIGGITVGGYVGWTLIGKAVLWQFVN